MDKRTPTLPDLLSQDATAGLVALPIFPDPWTQPATIDLLRAADDWPIKAALAPYVGCAMVAHTTTTTRKALIRVSGAVAYLRVDITQCSANDGSLVSTPTATMTGTDDSTAIELALSVYNYAAWPTEHATIVHTRGTTSTAIIDAPVADQNRQMEVTPSKAAQTEAITVNNNQSITIWASTRVADLLTL